MDLAQYKKAWENQPEEKNKLSALEIYKMTQAKSTSIVKWIFIIGSLEFLLWIVLNIIFSQLNYLNVYEELDLIKYINFSYYFNFLVLILFLVVFYKNYTSVSSVDNTKTLIQKIIKVRKTVKFYVYYNIISTVAIMIIFNIIIANTPGGMEAMFNQQEINLDPSELLTVYIVSQVIAMIVVIAFLFLFYYLLYGLLLKKLNRNYKELTKLEDVK
ncbi:MAG: hypothetical protein JKY02_02145 [Flavobacteriaceae bacterium]|nr:hypothetical protein [Flavobacteriaceae bacterium]